MRKSKTREKQPEKYAHTSFEGCLHIFFPHFSYTFFLDTTTATHRQLPHFTFTFLRRIKLRGVAKGINFTSKIFRQKKKREMVALEERPSPVSHTWLPFAHFGQICCLCVYEVLCVLPVDFSNPCEIWNVPHQPSDICQNLIAWPRL